MQDVDAFETLALKMTHLLLAQVPPRHRSSYFTHIRTLGYSSGTYTCLWSEMFYGKDPQIGPMLKDRGLAVPAKGEHKH